MIYYLSIKRYDDDYYRIFAIDTSINEILRMKGAWRGNQDGRPLPTWTLRAAILDSEVDRLQNQIDNDITSFSIDL